MNENTKIRNWMKNSVKDMKKLLACVRMAKNL